MRELELLCTQVHQRPEGQRLGAGELRFTPARTVDPLCRRWVCGAAESPQLVPHGDRGG